MFDYVPFFCVKSAGDEFVLTVRFLDYRGFLGDRGLRQYINITFGGYSDVRIRTLRSSAVFILETVALVLSTVWLRRLCLFPFPLPLKFSSLSSTFTLLAPSANETRLPTVPLDFDASLVLVEDSACGLNVTLLRACAAAVTLSN